MSQVQELREIMLALYRRFWALQRAEICCHGVTIPQCYALCSLQQRGEMVAGELAEQLGLDASTVSRAMDVLVRNGSVQRLRPERGDRRRVLLRLTKKGRALTDKLMADGDAMFESLLSQFPRGERKQMIQALSRLTEALDRISCSSDCCS